MNILWILSALILRCCAKMNQDLFYDLKNGSRYNLHAIHEYDEIINFMKQLLQENPNYMQMVDVGITYEWRNIQGIRISTSLSDFGYRKDVLWLDGGIHAREWNTPATAVIVITKKTRMWRKNRNNCPCKRSEPSCFHEDCCGVDLNRNFDAGWRLNTVDNRREDAVCGETFDGNDANGEPETRSIINYLSSVSRLRSYVSLHDSGQIWMYPYARANNTFAKNVVDQKELSNHITSEIKYTHGRTYKVGNAPDVLYTAIGTSGDWAADHGVEFVFTVELPPNRPFWFAVVSEGLTAAGQDMWIAVQKIADRMVKYAPRSFLTK